MFDFLSQVEIHNAPHFMRGFFICLLAWVIALKNRDKLFFKVISPPVWFSFMVTLLFAIGWEFLDLSRGAASDGFSFLDICFDMLGALGVHVTHLATHRYDER